MALIDFKSHKVKQRVNFVYGIGAAVVIVGATFKILHLPHGELIIGIGMFVEAALFVLSAFEPVPVEHDHLHWERLYPALTDPNAKTEGLAVGGGSQIDGNVEELLSKKLDEVMKEAKLDVKTMESLTTGIKNLGEAAGKMSSVADAAGSSQKYSQEMAKAANHMESLNSLYSVQIEEAREQVDKNKVVLDGLSSTIEGSRKLQTEVNSLAENLSSLNNVYGGMLSAMSRG